MRKLDFFFFPLQLRPLIVLLRLHRVIPSDFLFRLLGGWSRFKPCLHTEACITGNLSNYGRVGRVAVKYWRGSATFVSTLPNTDSNRRSGGSVSNRAGAGAVYGSIFTRAVSFQKSLKTKSTFNISLITWGVIAEVRNRNAAGNHAITTLWCTNGTLHCAGELLIRPVIRLHDVTVRLSLFVHLQWVQCSEYKGKMND